MTGSASPLVYSVVLTYNNFADTDECLRSLVAQDYPRHEVILVDNGSSDGSAEELAARWQGRVRFIETGANLGVAGGYNAGLRAALAAGADYAVTCNNDIVAAPSFISELVAVFGAQPRAAAVLPIVTYFDAPQRVWFARATMHPWFGLTRNHLRGRELAQLAHLAGSVQESDWLPTCASMLSRAALESVGLMDERFFYGHDDVDWCLEARSKGFACLLLARPLVKHKVSVTAGKRGSGALSPKAAYTHALGSVLVGAKHFRGRRAVAFLLGLLAVRLPYNLAVLAAAGRWQSVSAYLRGLVLGLGRYGPALFGLKPAQDAGPAV